MDVQLPGVMTVGEAAEVLGVSMQQVGYLGRRGQVTFVARGLLDAASVRALRAARQGRHTRALAPHTAWAAIAMLSGRSPYWLGQPQVSRLRARLLRSDTADLIADTRTRAKVYRYTGHRSAAARISEEPGTVLRRPLPELVNHRSATETDWYVDARRLDGVKKRFGLIPSESGDFVLRAVQTGYWRDAHTSNAPNWTIHPDQEHDHNEQHNQAHDHDQRHDVSHNREQEREGVDLPLVAAVMLESNVLTALDSSTSEDPRERGVAERILDDALTSFYRRVSADE